MSLTILLFIYLGIGFICGILAGIMFFVTLGGSIFVINSTDSTFYDNFMSFVGKYLSLLKYIAYYLYLIVYIWLIRAIYINNLTHKELSNKPVQIEESNEK